MNLIVAKETAEGETRVALVPETVRKLSAVGLTVLVERGAGERASFPDDAFAAAGATIVASVAEGFARPAATAAPAAMLLRVRPPTPAEAQALPDRSLLLASLMPRRHPDSVRALAAGGVTAFSTDTIPRTTRAQAMDTLSSMANISGYRGVLLAAAALPRYFPMFMTAAGTIMPARVFVIGAGVAGLQAIATARRLGANVFATDVRPEVKEQIESVGAKYVGVEVAAAAAGGYAAALSEADAARQRQMLADHCATCDVVITTALIGGVTAPRLLDAAVVERMKPGSVVMDLAADGGGNCELSQPGATRIHRGVTIMAPLNLPAGMPQDASTLWSRNLAAFITAFWKDGRFNLTMEDEILRGALITHEGQIVHAPTREALA